MPDSAHAPVSPTPRRLRCALASVHNAAPALTDLFLVGLLGLVAFLLVCNQFRDADIWWHLRAGEWIARHGRVPDTDPFTFGSLGRPWINLQWVYELTLHHAFGAGGIPGVMILGAAVVSVAAMTGVAARPAGAPVPVALLCWLPALALTVFRDQPRPEVFTLLFLAAYLCVLARLDRCPRLAWLLPAVEILWVNSHSLFAFGPIVLAIWWVARLVPAVGRWLRGLPADPGRPRRWWLHVGAATAAVLLACLANPYGLRGALFPLVIYPRATQQENPYKESTHEQTSARKLALLDGPENVGRDWHFCAFHLLLLVVPLSFLLPGLWEATRPAPSAAGEAQEPRPPPPGRPHAWLALLAASVLLAAARSATLTPEGRPAWLAAVGWAAPLLFAAAGVAGGALLAGRSPAAARLALAAGVGIAAWTAWLPAYLLGARDADPTWPNVALVTAAGCAAASAALLPRDYERLFGMLLTGAFGYLAFNAIYNWGRFGLVAGVVLSANLGPWVGQLLQARPGARALGWAGRLGVAALLLGWVAVIVTGRYERWGGPPFGPREAPLTFAHDAVRFAGRPGLSGRSLVYPVSEASLYVFYHAPERLTYIDPRTEVASLETFQTYLAVWKLLLEGGPKGPRAAQSLGAGVVVLGHEQNASAEATLLARPDWRLVYFDAMASVFVSAPDRRAAADVPTLDLAARHFARPHAPSTPDAPGAARKEARALFNLAFALRRNPDDRWRLRVPVLLAAIDRAEVALAEQPGRSSAWHLLGDCHWSLLPELRAPPGDALRGWDPRTELAWAQVTYCFRQGLERDPQDPALLQALYRCYAFRGLADAQRDAGERLAALGKASAEQAATVRQLSLALPRCDSLPQATREQLPAELECLLDAHRPEAAALLARDAVARGTGHLNWPLADRLAGACLHLGQPDLARSLWQQARGAPSEALRQCRLGDADWVARYAGAAAGHYREARRLDPRLTDPCWALAWLNAEAGRAAEARAACRDALGLGPPAPLREELEALERLLAQTMRPGPPGVLEKR